MCTHFDLMSWLQFWLAGAAGYLVCRTREPQFSKRRKQSACVSYCDISASIERPDNFIEFNRR